MARLIMTLGLPASGKSTWAKEQVIADGDKRTLTICKDDIRRDLGLPWSRQVEEKVIGIRDRAILGALGQGYTLISADTNLAPQHQTRLRELAEKAGADFLIQDFRHVPVLTCIERDALREGEARVGERVIRDMAEQYLPKDLLVPGRRTPQLFVDLDGVLADFDGFVAEQFGIENNRENEPPDFWDVVGAYKGRLYYDMKPMPGALELWGSLKPYEPIILSGAPFGHIPNAGFDKRAWVKDYIDPDARVITCKSRNKSNYLVEGDILIDDWVKHKALWEAKKGVWITYKGDNQATLAAVQNLLDKA